MIKIITFKVKIDREKSVISFKNKFKKIKKLDILINHANIKVMKKLVPNKIFNSLENYPIKEWNKTLGVILMECFSRLTLFKSFNKK